MYAVSGDHQDRGNLAALGFLPFGTDTLLTQIRTEYYDSRKITGFPTKTC